MYGNVFGNMNLVVSLPTETESEELALLQANYRLHPELIIGYELIVVNCHGERIKVDVHDSNFTVLDEFIEV